MQIWIIDTNVLIAGLLTSNPRSPTSRILESMLSGSLVYVLSPALLAEYRAVLLRPKLTKLHGLNESEVDQILIEITANAKWSDPAQNHTHHPPDGGDKHLWDLLAAHPEATLVTGDQLLIQNPRPGSCVVLPDAVLTLL